MLYLEESSRKTYRALPAPNSSLGGYKPIAPFYDQLDAEAT